MTVPAIPIDTLLEYAYQLCGARVRYLNIDVEGADEAILMSIEPQVFGVEVVQFEDNLNLGGPPCLRSHMAKCGFTLIASQGGLIRMSLMSLYKSDFLEQRKFVKLCPIVL